MVATPQLAAARLRAWRRSSNTDASVVDRQTAHEARAAHRPTFAHLQRSRRRRRLWRRGAAAGARASRLARAVRHHHAQSGRRHRGRGGRLPVLRGDSDAPAHAAGRRRRPRQDGRRSRRRPGDRAPRRRGGAVAGADGAHRRAHAVSSRRSPRLRSSRRRRVIAEESSRASCSCLPRCCACTGLSRTRSSAMRRPRGTAATTNSPRTDHGAGDR